MKKIILFFFLLQVNNLMAQSKMNIYYTNGSVLSIPISDVDSLYYVNSNTCPATVTDIDGNIYNAVEIGAQCWMKENLATTRYRNGNLIMANLSNTDWSNTTIGAYSEYNNDTTISSVYGKLYNWYAVVNSSGLCPSGWHVPDNIDWNRLVKFIDTNADTNCVSCMQSLTAGGALKEVGLVHWLGQNNGATNSTGFTALPAGSRSSANGSYSNLGSYTYFWTSISYSVSQSFFRLLLGNNGLISKAYLTKCYGLSVRCIRD